MYITKRIRLSIINKLKNKFNDWLPTLSNDEKEAFHRLLIHTNLLRMRVISIFIIFVMVAFLLPNSIYLINSKSTEIIRTYWYIISIRLIIIGVSLTLLFAIRKLTSLDGTTRNHYYWEFSYILFSVVSLSLLTGVSQPTKSDISVYLIAVFTSSAFLYLSGLKSVVIFGSAWVVMATVIWNSQGNQFLALSHIINGLIMTLLALFTSRMIYINRLQEFRNKRLIEQQKEELSITNVKLERLSYQDALTDLPNRRHFNQYIIHEWKRAAREKEILSLIMIDIDYFKQFNDTFGHLDGDECLISVASTLNKIIKRPSDLVVRYGGEEFVVVLPKTDLTAQD